jgi:transcriptional regulator with XRE-family HTH domain
VTGPDVRNARKNRGLRQQALAQKLGVSQGYVSLLERNHRPVPPRLAARVAAALGMPATSLPLHEAKSLEHDDAAPALGRLGYHGFAYQRGGRRLNPTELLLRTLRAENVDGRVVAALPWLLVQYPELRWDWLVRLVKQEDLQNRLGFLVSLARGVADAHHPKAAEVLRVWEKRLEPSRLMKSDSFSRSALTDAERRWLTSHRSREAKHWNVLSTLTAATLRNAV